MSEPSKEHKKGFFTAAGLGLAKQYIRPRKGMVMLLVSLVSTVLVALYFAVVARWDSLLVLAEGPLSSNHAMFAGDCASCHQPLEAVPDTSCKRCHERSDNEAGIYTFAAHYVYRSGDMGRIAEGEKKFGHHEPECAECHPEHRGRDWKAIEVPDSQCTSCHGFQSFNHGHPEFAFIREKLEDPAGLVFTHIRHTEAVYKFLVDRGESPYLEKTCLYCHQVEADGKNFQPIDFDKHCGDCHLGTGFETPNLDVAGSGDQPGVLTLEMIRATKKPGTAWAYRISPNEFTVKRNGQKIVKSPVVHRDPWIMHNLNAIRSELYPELGLGALLNALGGDGDKNVDVLYLEAIDTLTAHAAQLRSRPEPEIRLDLIRIEKALKLAREKVNRTGEPLSEAAFAIEAGQVNPALSEQRRNALESLAQELTSGNNGLCSVCHAVAQARIPRVQERQNAFHRAKFDHRAHILVSRCLDCHAEIPITKEMSGGAEVPASADSAAIQNLPGIQSCQACHRPESASNTCVTCHHFHPDTTRFSDLR